MIEKDQRATQLIISNADLLSHKASGLIEGKSKTLTYSDFFDQHQEFKQYLLSLNVEKEELRLLLQQIPDAPKTTFSLWQFLLLIAFISVLSIFLLLLIIYFWIAVLILGISAWILLEERRKQKLRRIIQFYAHLKAHLDKP